MTARLAHRTIAVLVLWLSAYSTEIGMTVLCLRWLAARYLPHLPVARPSRWISLLDRWARTTATALTPPMWLLAASAKA